MEEYDFGIWSEQAIHNEFIMFWKGRKNNEITKISDFSACVRCFFSATEIN